MFRMTDHRIRKRITDKQTNAGEMIENKIGIMWRVDDEHQGRDCKWLL